MRFRRHRKDADEETPGADSPRLQETAERQAIPLPLPGSEPGGGDGESEAERGDPSEWEPPGGVHVLDAPETQGSEEPAAAEPHAPAEPEAPADPEPPAQSEGSAEPAAPAEEAPAEAPPPVSEDRPDLQETTEAPGLDAATSEWQAPGTAPPPYAPADAVAPEGTDTGAGGHPELLVGAAFAGGIVLALVLRRLRS